jgi:CheY-like chemotaxis protein
VIEIPDSCVVLAQPQKLELVVINIVNNALDALNENHGARLTISATTDADMITVRFTDDGPGFADASRVFDPFYSTKPAGAGTGLGLSLVHRFVTEFGGTVTARNNETGGACIALRLPRSNAEPVPSRMATPISTSVVIPSGVAKRQRALIVDDERALRLVQSRLLDRLGIEVDVVENGTDACLALMRQEYDVVVTDLRMPGEIGGLELLEWIRRERPLLQDRVIVVTGDLMADDDANALLPPPERIILKPFESAVYQRCVQQVLDRAEAISL